MRTHRAVPDPVRLEQAIAYLQRARRLLRKAGCKRAARRVAGAMKSAEGARRLTAPRHLTIAEAMAVELGAANEAFALLREAGAS